MLESFMVNMSMNSERLTGTNQGSDYDITGKGSKERRKP
jgi:hypothetical protein